MLVKNLFQVDHAKGLAVTGADLGAKVVGPKLGIAKAGFGAAVGIAAVKVGVASGINDVGTVSLILI